MSLPSTSDHDFVIRVGMRVHYARGNARWPVTVVEQLPSDPYTGERWWFVEQDEEPLHWDADVFDAPESRLHPMPNPSLRGEAGALYVEPPPDARPRRRPPRAKRVISA
jgi:hypothetical protein